MSQQLVENIKARLVAQGVDLSGPCGAFKVTLRVAWALRAQGFGLLAKGGTNCGGFSTDAVILPDGTHYDVLTDAGGGNGPIWHLVTLEGTDLPYKRPEDYRPAIDPLDGETPDPAPVPIPQPPADLSVILDRLAALDAKMADQMTALEATVIAVVGDLESHVRAEAQAIRKKQDRRYAGNTKAFGGRVELTPQEP